MAFSRQVYAGAYAQSLAALTRDAAEVLVFKHIADGHIAPGQAGLLNSVRGGGDEAVGALAAELVSERPQIQHSAPTRHVFDSRVADLGKWLFHDGWNVEDGALVRIAPAVEEATGVRDHVLDQLGASGLDGDGAIRQAINEAATAFNANPPDFNDSVVKVRTALEAVGRRGATQIAQRRQAAYAQDSWGRALTLLRQQNVISQDEEELFARTYHIHQPRSTHSPESLTRSGRGSLGPLALVRPISC